MLGKKQKYSLDFKLSVIQAVKNGQYSAEQVALHFGIPNSGIISQWLHTFDKQGIEMLLPMVGLKCSTFFYHLAKKSDKNADIVQKVAEIYHENQGNYGYRRITLVLRRIGRINHKKVQAIMQRLGLKGKCKRRKYRSYQGEVGKIADNLLQQNFHASAPNQKWVTDVTELKCEERKLYLSPIKDLTAKLLRMMWQEALILSKLLE